MSDSMKRILIEQDSKGLISVNSEEIDDFGDILFTLLGAFVQVSVDYQVKDEKMIEALMLTINRIRGNGSVEEKARALHDLCKERDCEECPFFAEGESYDKRKVCRLLFMPRHWKV